MFLQRAELDEALRISREEPSALTDAQKEIVAAFWARRAEVVALSRRLPEPPPPPKPLGPTPVEECVHFPSDVAAALQGHAFESFSSGPLRIIAAMLGPVASLPLHAASHGQSYAFRASNFVPTGRRQNRQMRRWTRGRWMDEDDGTLSDRPDLDDEEDFLSALNFEKEFEQLYPWALDDLFLALRRKMGEDCLEHRARLNEHFANSFVHVSGAAEMVKLARRCWLPSNVARCVFPNHVYSPASEYFFPRPLHVAVLGQDLLMAKMLLRFATVAKCNMDTLLHRDFTPHSNFTAMTPLFLALLVTPDMMWEAWSTLFVKAGARFNRLDSCIAGNIVAHDQLADAQLQAFDQRIRSVFSLLGTPSEQLEEELRKFEDTGFDTSADEVEE